MVSTSSIITLSVKFYVLCFFALNLEMLWFLLALSEHFRTRTDTDIPAPAGLGFYIILTVSIDVDHLA